MSMNRILYGFMVLAAAVLLSGCEQERFSPEQEVTASGSLVTKAVNTSDYAQQGNILLLLSEQLVFKFENGMSDASFVSVCDRIGVTKVEKVFPDTDDEISRRHRLHRWYKVYFSSTWRLELVASRFAQLSSVEAVQYNTVRPKRDVGPVYPYPVVDRGGHDMDLPFNDPLLVDQWHYINNKDYSICPTVREGADVGVRNVWGVIGGDPRVIVAVCDEGIKYTHPDLAANMWVNEGEIPGNGLDDDNNGYIDDVHGYNFLNPAQPESTRTLRPVSWDAPGDIGHGTHVAGVIAAVNNNAIGTSGVAGGTGSGDGVRLMSCQVYSGDGVAGLDARARSYKYAADNGASVLQCSFGSSAGKYDSDIHYENACSIEKDALAYFMDRPNCDALDGNIVICASGNEASPYSCYPAAYHDYVSVTAIGPDYLPARYTNYGPGCNIAAPGGDISTNPLATGYRAQILSTVPSELKAIGADYGYMQGTALAASHVSGVVALGLSYALRLGLSFSYDEFMSMVYSSVNDIDYLIDTSIKTVDGEIFDIIPMKGGMGTGAIDAWRLIMQVEGVPSLVVKKGDWCKVPLNEYFGGSAANLTYTSIEIDPISREILGVDEEPYISNGKLLIKCARTGSAKMKITAIAGGPEAGGGANIGGTEFSRVISVLSRDIIASNGGWL